MIFTLFLENTNGDRVDMTTTANQYMTAKVEGLNPPPGTISTSGYQRNLDKRQRAVQRHDRGLQGGKNRHDLHEVDQPFCPQQAGLPEIHPPAEGDQHSGFL